MGMETNQTKHFPSEPIKQAIETMILAEVKDAVEIVKKRLDEKVPEIVAGILINILQMPDYEKLQNRIIFEIKQK